MLFLSLVVFLLPLSPVVGEEGEVRGREEKREEKREDRGPAFRLALGGDTCFGESYQEPIARRGGRSALAGGYDATAAGIAPLLAGADLVVANLETPLTRRRSINHAWHKAYIHYGDGPLTTAALRRMGVGLVSLANNHAVDQGPEGLVDTLGYLEAAGIAVVGAGRNAAAAATPYVTGPADRPLVVLAGFEHCDRHAAWGWYAGDDRPGVNDWTDDSAAAQVREARRRHPGGFIVAYPHWGANYAWADETQRRLAGALARAGADLVVGHGAHAIQDLDLVDRVPVIYSLGNMVFNTPGRWSEARQPPAGFVARVDVADPGATVRLVPVASDNRVTGYRPGPVDGELLGRVRLALEGRPCHDPAWRASWRWCVAGDTSWLALPLVRRRSHSSP